MDKGDAMTFFLVVSCLGSKSRALLYEVQSAACIHTRQRYDQCVQSPFIRSTEIDWFDVLVLQPTVLEIYEILKKQCARNLYGHDDDS